MKIAWKTQKRRSKSQVFPEIEFLVYHQFKSLNYSTGVTCAINQRDKIALAISKDINGHTLTLPLEAHAYTLYICIYVIASRKSRVSARLQAGEILFLIFPAVSLREFGPLINFEPLRAVLNGNCQASAIAREKLPRVVATSISARAKTNRNPAIYPDATLIWRNCHRRVELFAANSAPRANCAPTFSRGAERASTFS